jgi:hypothetical protein
LGGVQGQKILKEAVRFPALTSGGFKEAADDAVILETIGGTGALDDSAHNECSALSKAAFWETGCLIGYRVT